MELVVFFFSLSCFVFLHTSKASTGSRVGQRASNRYVSCSKNDDNRDINNKNNGEKSIEERGKRGRRERKGRS